jgi:hypothetical protein
MRQTIEDIENLIQMKNYLLSCLINLHSFVFLK